MITHSVPRKRLWILLAVSLAVALVAGQTRSVRADAAPDLDAQDWQGEAEPVTPDHHPIIIIRRPGYPIYIPGFPIYFYPIYPYPHPCGRNGLLPPPPPQPGLPTPAVTAGPVPTLRPVVTPTPGGQAQSLQYRVCPQVTGLIPQDVQDLATNEPWRFQGYGERRNPGIPYHPLWNSYRTWLSLRDTAQPYSLCNYPLWKAGCP